MRFGTRHASDLDLIRLADGEISRFRRTRIAAHLDDCAICADRMDAIRREAALLTDVCRSDAVRSLPAAEAPRRQLRERLRSRTAHPEQIRSRTRQALASGLVLSTVATAGVIGGIFLARAFGPTAPPLRPDPELTLGATVGVSARDVCKMDLQEADIRPVPPSVGRDVFAEYGVSDSDVRPYELDYLIPPELGGSADVHNLWPQAYSTPVWNAHVKDALEEHLYGMVCRGELGLAVAQTEIARDWIAAYRKYFGTDLPASDHLAFMKDHPWQN